MKISVMKYSRVYITLSAIAILTSIAAMFISWQQVGAPLRPGIDFTGGTRITLELACLGENIGNNENQPPLDQQLDAEIGTEPTESTSTTDSNSNQNEANQACGDQIDIGAVRKVMAENGYGNSVIQLVGNNGRGLSIRTVDLNVDERSQLQQNLAQALEPFGRVDPKQSQIERVGPLLGKQLFTSGILALAVSFIGIAAYLTVRFQSDYAFFAIAALVHDVIITLGVFAILGLTFQIEVDSLFVVAILTIIGFSVNDTVVVFDRIRENLKLSGDRQSFSDIVDISINQTFARSINTTVTALFALIAIFLFGGATLRYFALALIIGFASGAYSSIFNASILLAWWRNRGGGSAGKSSRSGSEQDEPEAAIADS
ncbi:protein translocase subunit secF [Thalassoporum mexicanum PCC 7367]|uniref:protein translocase subunit SecF n=1 Tax=Thalassoporum mexicanum TaxID=3457544 RepID=UPI00029FB34D|nr:protein translocase subunit SecF [Pseudanabaena sp. PCC 7367]AFY68608.1 protein translocase subunit secF [Pseudanabaena sp. PCC 7367]